MIRHILLLEIFISIWYIKEIVVNNDQSIFAMIIVLLVYHCLKVIYYIFSDKNFSKYILVLITIMVVGLGYSIFQPITYFLSINLTQSISAIRKENLYLSCVALVYALFIPINYLQNFIILNMFALLLMIVSITMAEKSMKLSAENVALKSKMEELKEVGLNTKRYALNLRHTSKLEERNAIAQKLHDELGHTLSGSTMQLEASLLMMDKNKEKAKDMLNVVIKNLRDGTESIRKILKSIKPENASINIQTIKMLTMEAQEKCGITIDLIYSSDIADIDYIKWHVITINIKEALTNMMKYSKATKCTIKFERLNKLYKISINDNGIGCNSIKRGMGLQGMDERTAKIGGQLILDGADGFSVIMLLPIKKG